MKGLKFLGQLSKMGINKGGPMRKFWSVFRWVLLFGLLAVAYFGLSALKKASLERQAHPQAERVVYDTTKTPPPAPVK